MKRNAKTAPTTTVMARSKKNGDEYDDDVVLEARVLEDLEGAPTKGAYDHRKK